MDVLPIDCNVQDVRGANIHLLINSVDKNVKSYSAEISVEMAKAIVNWLRGTKIEKGQGEK